MFLFVYSEVLARSDAVLPTNVSPERDWLDER